MHIHLSHGFDPEIVSQYLSEFSVSNGGDPPDNTEILVDGHPSMELVSSLHELKVLVIPFAGMVPRTRGVALAHPQLSVYNLHHNAAATAEKAIELMMAVAKRTVVNDQKMRPGIWCPRFDSSEAVELDGKRAVIFGFGSIGKRVGKVCEGLGMHVVGISRSNQADLAQEARRAEVLIVCAPLTAETEGAVSASVISELPSKAIVVNVGRGQLIDEESLFTALNENKIHGAGLDVWWQYPSENPECSPANYPFWTLPNVVMSPHCGGTVQETEPARFRALGKLLGQIRDRDTELRQVNVELGY